MGELAPRTWEALLDVRKASSLDNSTTIVTYPGDLAGTIRGVAVADGNAIGIQGGELRDGLGSEVWVADRSGDVIWGWMNARGA